MARVIHYIGFRDDAFLRAYRIYGGPAMIHRVNDRFAQNEIDPETDIAIYAGNEHEDRVRFYPAPGVTGPGYDQPE